MRFPPEQHLRRARDIREVREQGRRIDCRAFTIWWKRRKTAENAESVLDSSRVCVIASKAAVGGATHRNRAKRRLREVYRHHQSQLPRDCDLLLIARAAVNESPVPELQKKFIDACRQISTATIPQPK